MERTTLHMKIDPALKQRLAELAKLDNRTMSNLIDKVLKDFVDARK